MRKLSRFISAFLVVCTLSCVMLIPASAANDSSVGPYTIWPCSQTFYNVEAGVPGNTIDVKINFTCRDEASNSTGYYITGVLNAVLVGKSGWTSVRNVQVETDKITYTSNCQYANVPIKFEGSIGSGYAEYSTSVTITAKIGNT